MAQNKRAESQAEPRAEAQVVYPYIPNSVPAVKAEMMAEVGVGDLDELYRDVPPELRYQLELPSPLLSECELDRHVREILAHNHTCQEYLSFLGAGCWPHYVPAVCDEINQRSEFLTAYAGEPYEDHGRFQALFEYASMVAELVGMEVVSIPTYSGGQAAATALRMAARITGRPEVLVPRIMNPDRFRLMCNYCRPDVELLTVAYDGRTGALDLDYLRSKISARTAAVYVDVPSYFGLLEPHAQEIAALAHEVGALSVVAVDPISLGVLAPPSDYGADIVCGELQPLGIHMQFGGSLAGFIATRDEERFLREYPSRLFGIAPTRVPGEYGFGDVAFGRTSFALREKAKEFVGTAAALWGITAGVYLALMGPRGMQELGKGVMQRAAYAIRLLSDIPGLRIPVRGGVVFKEFLVNFDDTGRTVADVNRALLARGIFGGKDISAEFPELGQSALYCVTEVHTRRDIEKLAAALREIAQS